VVELRIVMISGIDAKQFYGGSVRPINLNRALSTMGVKIVHFCPRPPNENIKNTVFVSIPPGKSTAREIATKIKLIIETWRFHADVIYAHPYGHHLGIYLSRCLKKPLVLDFHGSATLESEAYGYGPQPSLFEDEKERLLATNRVIVASPALKEELLTRFPVQEEHLVVIPNSIDLPMFARSLSNEKLETTRRGLRIPDGNRVVAFTCPRRRDRYDTFLANEIALKWFFQLLKQVETKRKDVTYLILGRGEFLAAPSPSVLYTGFVEDLPTTLAISDACVLPYPQNAVCGGARNKALEYFASRKPVISTTEGMRGIMAESERDYLLADSQDEFAVRLLDVLSNNELAGKIAANGFRVAERYTWNELGKPLYDALSSVACNGSKC